MVLGIAIGWTLETFAGLTSAALFGALFGMLVANFVPLPRGSCGDA